MSLRSGDVRALPDTLLNGAMKSGTSSRRYYLTQHPLVIPPLRSEAHQCFSCLARGGHAGQRERWLQFYPREQLLILHFEDLARDPLLLTDESLVCTGLSPMSSASSNRATPEVPAAGSGSDATVAGLLRATRCGVGEDPGPAGTLVVVACGIV